MGGKWFAGGGGGGGGGKKERREEAEMVLVEAESGLSQPQSGEARTRFKTWQVLLVSLREG